MICPGGQILLSKRLPGTGQRLSASPATTIRLSYAMYSNDRDSFAFRYNIFLNNIRKSGLFSLFIYPFINKKTYLISE